MDTAEKTRALAEQLAINPLDPKELVKTFGMIGVWVIMFAETGLLVGFFFPGDSLLFLAGVAASPVADAIFGAGTKLNLAGLLIGAPICAIAGAQLGHFLGARYGRRMFDRPDSKLFKREYVEKAEFYFNKYGPAKAVVLARFIPIVRTFLNPVAGMLGMPAKTFLVWNIIGGILWTDGVIFGGYILAEQIIKVIDPAEIDTYILPVVILIIILSVLPIFFEMLRDRRHRKAAAEAMETSVDMLGAAAHDLGTAVHGLATGDDDADGRPAPGTTGTTYGAGQGTTYGGTGSTSGTYGTGGTTYGASPGTTYGAGQGRTYGGGQPGGYGAENPGDGHGGERADDAYGAGQPGRRRLRRWSAGHVRRHHLRRRHDIRRPVRVRPATRLRRPAGVRPAARLRPVEHVRQRRGRQRSRPGTVRRRRGNHRPALPAVTRSPAPVARRSYRRRG